MSDSFFDRITSDEMDALQEIGNIGSGHSANALAELLNRRIDMSLPRFNIIKAEEFSKVKWYNQSMDNKFAAISCKTEGDLNLDILIVMDQNTILGILQLMRSNKEKVEITELSALDRSLIAEVGSILALHYLTAINTFLGTKSFPKAPSMVIDSTATILKNIGEHVIAISSKMLLVECDIFTSDTKLNPTVILVPEEKSVETSIKLMFGDY
jgi:chemotaxis protein CheC